MAAPAAPLPRARGFALLWLAAILVPLAGVALAGVMSWRDIREEAEARIERSVEMLRQHALRAFGTQEAILAAAARTIDGMDWEGMRLSRAAHEMLADLVRAAAPVVSGIIVIDASDHTILGSYEFPARDIDLSERDYVQALRLGAAEVSVGEVVTSRPMGWRVFAVARRAPPRPGEPGRPGLIASSFSPAPFEGFYASVVENPGDVIVLLREDGALLAGHPPLPDGLAEPALRAAVARSLPTLDGSASPVEPAGSPVDGQERLYAVRQVGEWPVLVAYGMDTAALRSAWRHRMLAPVAGGLAAAALLLALTAIAARGARRERQEAESRAEAEAHLARAGRAAALGLLTAGLAHDVKNLVQAVRSGARLMERRADHPAEVRHCAVLLADAAERGGRLVDGMLAFARGGAEMPEVPPPLDLPAALPPLLELLGHTLGSGWRVRADIPPDLPHARGDRAGFEAAVVNLAANARDAMPGGGTVAISARRERLVEPSEAAGLRAGAYVVVAVADGGAGMDAETLARIGEPFFTTKSPGIGTGLGLATVRGFCAHAGGALRIDSTPGQGTTAEMWLPVA
jgi:signal transduction histidine kinase